MDWWFCAFLSFGESSRRLQMENERNEQQVPNPHTIQERENKVWIKHLHIYSMYRTKNMQGCCFDSHRWTSAGGKAILSKKNVRGKINFNIFAKRPLASSHTSLEQHRCSSGPMSVLILSCSLKHGSVCVRSCWTWKPKRRSFQIHSNETLIKIGYQTVSKGFTRKRKGGIFKLHHNHYCIKCLY